MATVKPDLEQGPDYDEAHDVDYADEAQADYDEGAQAEYNEEFADPDAQEGSQEWYARKQK